MTSLNPTTTSFTNRLSDNFRNEDCLTIDQLATELGVKKQRTRQILQLALKKRLMPDLSKRDGSRMLYPEQMAQALKNLYTSNSIVKRAKHTTAPHAKNAQLLIEVPVFDAGMKDILLKKFGTEQKIAEFCRDALHAAYKPVLAQLQDLDAEYERKKQDILKASAAI